jgi:hypothetical protein
MLSDGFSEVVPILAVGTIHDAGGAIGDFLRRRGHGRHGHGRHGVKPTAKKGNASHSMARGTRGTEPDFSAFSWTFFDSVEG